MRIELRDDGPGFPPDSLDRVTEPFFTTKRSGDRRGLGLAEVGRFATRSGGRLRVENRDEGGACVRMEFPARDLREPRADAPSVSIRREGARGVAFVGRPGPQRRWVVGPESLRRFSYLGHEIRLLVLSADLGGLAPEDLARVLRSEAEGLEVTSELDLELVLRESDGTLSFASAKKA